jgi:arsenate reductase
VGDKVYHVLFLCTGNSARSVMAEVLLNELGKGRFMAFSAGSHPAGRVNPFTLELLARNGYPAANLRSKSWDEFAAAGAPHMDFLITVCDSAAGEACPYWPGQPMSAHWGFEDPAAFAGTDDEKRAKFQSVYHQIANRLKVLLSVPVERLDRIALQQKLKEIGNTQP